MGHMDGGLLSEASLEEDFRGKVGQSVIARVQSIHSKRVSLIVLVKSASTTSDCQSLGESLAAAAKASQASSVAVALASSEGLSNDSNLSTTSAITSGTVLGVYKHSVQIRVKETSFKICGHYRSWSWS